MRYGLVVPAAGSGRRLPGALPKQYQLLAGRAVLEHALRPFLADPDCTAICVAVSRGDAEWPALAMRLGNSRVTAVIGGLERAHSVRLGLEGLEHHLQPNDWVMVHDAARPCVTCAEIDALKGAVGTHAIGGILALPLADTLKRAGADTAQNAPASIEATVPREWLWRALTPQMFRFAVLEAALDAALESERLPTDEAQAVEWLGHHPLLVPGSTENLKITTPADLAVAEALLMRRAAS
jgi:2-C-methyl-D-erythritol 4-phosphate cytidylyltransferase